MLEEFRQKGINKIKKNPSARNCGMKWRIECKEPPAFSGALACIMYMLSTHPTDGSEFGVFSLVC